MGSDNMLAKVIIRIVLAPFLKSNDSLWRTGQQSPRRLTKRNIAIAAVELFRQLFFFFFFFFLQDPWLFQRRRRRVFYVWCCHHAITFSIDARCASAVRTCQRRLSILAGDRCSSKFMCNDGGAHKVLKKNTRNMFVCVCVQCTYRLYITRLLGRAQCIATARIIRVTLFTQLIWSE